MSPRARASEVRMFVWTEHVWEVISTALLSMVPGFEGRYAVVTGVAMGIPVALTFLMALAFSTIPMPLIMRFMKPALRWLYARDNERLKGFAAWVERRSARMRERVDAKGLIGLFLYVAIPLTGTGVWTGTMIAAAMGMNRRHAYFAITAGNIVAIGIMTAVSAGIFRLF